MVVLACGEYERCYWQVRKGSKGSTGSKEKADWQIERMLDEVMPTPSSLFVCQEANLPHVCTTSPLHC